MAPPTPKDPTTEDDDRLSSYIGGIACRLPQSPNVEILWKNLIDKVDMIGDTRWPLGVYDLPRRCGTITDVDEFDNCFFNLPISEAAEMPCMLRILLEVIYESIIDSGIPRQTLSKSRTGLYLAINFCEDQEVNRGINNSNYINTKSDFIYRIFSILHLSGPATSVDTACCSSLSALQMANMDLHTGRCDYAIVAGANLLENLNHSIQFYKLGMLSPNGISLPFDEKANGYVRSEGVVAILLSSRPLLHRIYAKIDDVRCFCDGYKEAGILCPSEKDQISLLQEIYKDRYPVYVEAHATGTQLGDETELKALKSAFGDNLKKPLLIGSCKSNLGHTEACAGLVGILKCVLSIHHGILPPNINLDSPHPLLMESDPWAKVVTEETKLPDGYIGVSCFGFGGVIGHVILEQLPMNIINIPKYVLLPIKLQAHNQSKKIIDYIDVNIARTDTLCLMATASFCLTPEPEFHGCIKILNDEMLVDVTDKVGDKTIYLVLNDFFFTDQSIFDQDFLQIECVRNSFTKIQSILNSNDSDVVLAKVINLEERGIRDKFFLCAATMIAYLDLLMLCNFKPDRILGFGLSEIILAYYDDCISLETCLSILNLVATHLENNTATAVDERSFLVKQQTEEIEKLSEVVVVTESALYVNIPRAATETLEIKSDWLEISPPIHAYWQYKLDKTLTLKLKGLFHPKERSARWISCVTVRDISLKDHQQFGPNYVNHLLTRPIDLSSVKVLEESNVFYLNGDKRLKHVFVESVKITYCYPNCSNVLSTLGKLHLLTDDIDISRVNADLFPLDHTAPPIGHLITWNHETWTLPEWQHYCISIKDQFVSEFPVGLHEDIYEPMPILIVNLIEVIQEPMCAISVDITYLEEFDREKIDGALITLHEGMRKIAVFTEDDEILIGFFQYMEKLPEYLMLDNKFARSISATFDYDGTFIGYINSAYKYGCSKFNCMPCGFFYDEKLYKSQKGLEQVLHIEYETGTCQAGGFVFKFLPKSTLPKLITEEPMNILVTCVILYNISQQTRAFVMIYTGCSEDETQCYVGICLLADDLAFVQKQIKVPRRLDMRDLSKILPYIISHHLLNEILSLNKKQTLVIHPQYDSLSMYMAIIAKDLCQQVYMCSWGEEIADELQKLIPEVTVLSAQDLNKVLHLLKGRGFDAAIKFSGTDLSRSLLSMAENGYMVVCGKPNLLEDLRLGVFLKNISFKVTEPLNAVLSFFSSNKSWEESLMRTMSCEKLNELWDSDFMKEPSSVYEILQNSDLDKIRLSTVIPYLKLKIATLPTQTLSPADDAFIKNLHATLSVVTKTFFKRVCAIPKPLDAGLSPTRKVKQQHSSHTSSPLKSPELYFKRKPAHCRTLTASLRQISQENESLFILSPTRSPFSPEIKEFIKKAENLLVQLNSKTGDCPLIFIHPITGVLSLLKDLCSKLSVPCYGIQMTELTPRTSIKEVASFYIKALCEEFPKGPYRLVGYSFGACVVLEMALQMQSNLKVELLLMLDGSPKYIKFHCEYIKEEVSGIATNKSEKELVEIGYMVSFAGLYKSLKEKRRALIYSSLLQLDDVEERIDFLQDFILGKTVESPGTVKMNWLKTSFWMREKKIPEAGLESAMVEFVRTSENKKCKNYIDNCKMGEKYNPKEKFKGPIHLFRIKTEPACCLALPTDYGIAENCSDTLVRFYNGDHITFLRNDTLHKDIEKLLKSLRVADQ